MLRVFPLLPALACPSYRSTILTVIASPRAVIACRSCPTNSTSCCGAFRASPIKNYVLLAVEAMLIREWDQCLSIIWFDEDLKPAGQSRDYAMEDDEPLLEELDGILPWPSKSRRK